MGEVMILGIDHIGIATRAPAGVAAPLRALGMSQHYSGLAESYGVACEFWGFADFSHFQHGTEVEVVSPATPGEGALRSHGNGLHHLAFEVDDLDFELRRLVGLGFVRIDKLPRAGARPGMRVAFLYAEEPAALLVELVEYRSGKPDRPVKVVPDAWV